MIDNVGDVLFTFLHILTHILLGLFSFNSAEANIKWNGKLNDFLWHVVSEIFEPEIIRNW